jgi:hypothetical protein
MSFNDQLMMTRQMTALVHVGFQPLSNHIVGYETLVASNQILHAVLQTNKGLVKHLFNKEKAAGVAVFYFCIVTLQ